MSTPTFAATGRRKTSVARVFLKAGTGAFTVNSRPFDDYFPTLALQNQLLAPLNLTGSVQTYDIAVNAHGGGVGGQMGAIRMGIARALCLANPENRPVLKKNGMLTRDSR